jgi:hypothetical protein
MAIYSRPPSHSQKFPWTAYIYHISIAADWYKRLVARQSAAADIPKGRKKTEQVLWQSLPFCGSIFLPFFSQFSEGIVTSTVQILDP